MTRMFCYIKLETPTFTLVKKKIKFDSWKFKTYSWKVKLYSKIFKLFNGNLNFDPYILDQIKVL